MRSTFVTLRSTPLPPARLARLVAARALPAQLLLTTIAAALAAPDCGTLRTAIAATTWLLLCPCLLIFGFFVHFRRAP